MTALSELQTVVCGKGVLGELFSQDEGVGNPEELAPNWRHSLLMMSPGPVTLTLHKVY